jgi:hypothetical protein
MDVISIPISSIKFEPSEETLEFKESINRLKDSIQQQGLFHPITVRPLQDGTHLLASGEKRLLALKALGATEIPCVIRAVESGESEELTHIHENLMRFNLPWFEQVELERRLHNLRISQHGQGKPGKKSGWSLRDTAEELDMSFGVLSEDIRIAEVIENNPQLKKIGDKKTARAVILKTLKQMSQEAESGLDVAVDVDINIVHCGSSEEILKAYPPNMFQACITDPPWLKFKDPSYTKDEFTLKVFEEIYRVLSPDSFMFAFLSLDDFLVYRAELPKFGFHIQQLPNIWVKEGVLTRGKRSWEYERDYEFIMVAVKGSPALTGSMLSAISSCKVVPPPKLTHPNEKPKEIITKIMKECTYDNALVLDPFAGSGVVCEVARNLGRRYVGIERSKEHYAKIQRRLSK